MKNCAWCVQVFNYVKLKSIVCAPLNCAFNADTFSLSFASLIEVN
jgi:hypothetical protein